VLTSAKIYIPEIVWNDDSTQFGLGASGGGPSALFTRPTWQTGVPGISAGTQRLVPDVSLYSSAGFPGYLFCTSDTSNWNTTATPVQQASCNSGFRDSTSGDLTVAGGTSFATPIFAGMIALINQKQQYAGGQGLANKVLYQLAGTPSTYASAFHDVTSGNNNCTAGATYCGTTTTGFSAGTGYDQVTGLGSVDLANLASAWPNSGKTLVATQTTVSAATTSPNVSTNDVITITVAQVGGTGIPTGTVNLSIDGSGTYNGTTTTPVTLTNGTATYTANFATTGAHTIVAQYGGDSLNAPSTGSVVITIGGTTSGKGTFSMAFTPTTLSLSQGSKGTEALTVTPAGGYTGTIGFTFSTSNDTALANLCVFAGTGFNTDTTLTVPGTAAVTGTVTIDTKASDCASTTGGAVNGRGLRMIPHTRGSLKASNNTPKRSNPVPAGIAFAGLLLAGFLGRSSRKLRQLACVIALTSLGLAISACGGGGGSSSSTGSGGSVANPAKGTYTITLAGKDTTTATITAQQSFTLVIN
jgi:subtilase family serine protease